MKKPTIVKFSRTLSYLLLFVLFFKPAYSRINIDTSALADSFPKKKQKPVVKPEMFKGLIEYDKASGIEEIPEFRVYFNGMETFNDHEGFFSFRADGADDLKEYSIIITKNVDYRVEKTNTLKELVIKDSKNYRHFSLQRSGPGNDEWSWKEHTLKTDNFVVPYKSILLFVNPKCLVDLKPWRVSLPDKFVPIPRIILNSEHKDWVSRQATKSLLYSLDLKPFHERVLQVSKVTKDGRGKMELIGR